MCGVHSRQRLLYGRMSSYGVLQPLIWQRPGRSSAGAGSGGAAAARAPGAAACAPTPAAGVGNTGAVCSGDPLSGAHTSASAVCSGGEAALCRATLCRELPVNSSALTVSASRKPQFVIVPARQQRRRACAWRATVGRRHLRRDLALPRKRDPPYAKTRPHKEL